MSVVVLGGGPGGYEAALVAAHLGAAVTVVDRDGLGGAAVLTDCVPSKALVSTSNSLSSIEVAGGLGVRFEGAESGREAATADLGAVSSAPRRPRRRARPAPRRPRARPSRRTAPAASAAS